MFFIDVNKIQSANAIINIKRFTLYYFKFEFNYEKQFLIVKLLKTKYYN